MTPLIQSLVICDIFAIIGIYVLWVASIHVAGRKWSGSKLTTATLVIGVIVTLLMCCVLYYTIRTIILMVTPTYMLREWWPYWLFTLSATSALGYTFFMFNKTDVNPGETVYFSTVGVPDVELVADVGEGSLPKPFMGKKKKDSAAHVVSLLRQEYTTGNGITLHVDQSAPWFVTDALKTEKIEDADEESFVQATIIAETFAFLRRETPDLDEAFKDNKLTREEAWKLVKKLTQFKSHTVGDGPKEIRDKVNEVLSEYGLKIGRKQIGNVKLNEKLESTIARIFDESLQQAEEVQDASNKAEVAKVYIDYMKASGLDVAQLDHKSLANLLSGTVVYALAAEGKANVRRIEFNEPPPAGTYVDPTNANI